MGLTHRRMPLPRPESLPIGLVLLLMILLAGGPAQATPQAPLPTTPGSSEAVIIEGIGFDTDLDQRLGVTAPASLDAPTPMAVVLRELPGELPAFIQQHNRGLDPLQVRYLAWALFRFSQVYGVDYRVIASLVAIESSFRTEAVSSSGAIGLGQLKPDTARWLGVRDPYHPADNAAGLTRYIRYLLDKYQGNLDKALSAYFQGPGTVDRQGITPQCLPYLTKFNAAFMRFPSATAALDTLGQSP